MTTYYKAVRPNGRDFYTNTITWIPEDPEFPYVVEHPDPEEGSGAARYFSVSVDATNCTGSQWPLRLLEVEAVEGHDVFTPDGFDLPSKRAATAFRILRELPAHLAFGPQGEQVVALIERARTLTGGEVDRLASAWGAARRAAWGAARRAAWGATRRAARDAAWDAAWRAAWGATRRAAWAAAWDAAWDAAWGATRRAAWDAREAARDAAFALLVRDLITPEEYDELSGPWRKTIGRIHEDDADLLEEVTA